MALVSAPVGLLGEVTHLLGGRVPSAVLDRVLVELVEAERGQSDGDLRRLLEDGVISASLRSGWGASGSASYLVGVRTPHAARLLSRVRMHAEAYRRDVRVCCVDDTVWLLLSLGSRRWAEELLGQPDMPMLLALSAHVVDLRLVASHRRCLSELLNLGWRKGWSGLADIARLEAGMKVEAMMDMLARQPALLEGPLDVLFESPAQRVFADTLYTWFQQNQDAAATAVAMHLHVNTVRYRLRRAREICGIDFADPDQRLLAELQLRSRLANTAGGRASRHPRQSDDKDANPAARCRKTAPDLALVP